MRDQRPILVTGSTGYIGGRLVPRLLESGWAVRCLVRDVRKLGLRPWIEHPRLEVVRGDAEDPESLRTAMRGCGVAYYLIHSMVSAGGDYAAQDREMACTFAAAAKDAGLERIIYLGGLGEMGPDLSEHLKSRREVEDALGSAGVPVTTLRAAMIIGSGSASFEILRYLVERLPVMVTPKWVRTESQPVAVSDVLHWLIECLDTPATIGRSLEIGGPDVESYRSLMQIMARQLGLPRRLIVPVPVLTPTLSSRWIGLVTPVSPAIARPLAEGLRNRVVVTDGEAQRLMPHEALGVEEAIARAVSKTRGDAVETRWSAAGVVPGDPDWAGGTVFEDRRTIRCRATPDAVFAAVCRVGGGHGWYAADWLWRVRGWMDQAIGGPGLRRGRRHPERVEFGEALDFWRVTDVQAGRRLALRAEMRLPGEAALEFDMAAMAEPEAGTGSGASTELVMTARFRPKGLLGLAYWYAVLPLHGLVFRGMLHGMQRAAEAIDRGEAPPPKPRTGDDESDPAPEPRPDGDQGVA